MVLASYCYCGDADEMQTSYKTLASKKAATLRLKSLRVTISFHEKESLSVITWNKKHFWKEVVPITYTLEKRGFFAAATFKGLWIVSF